MGTSTYFILVPVLLFSNQLSVQSLVLKSYSFEEQKLMVQQQLGYLPPNFHCVSAWTTQSKEDNAEPVAIQTYPLYGGAPKRQARAISPETTRIGTPFPTLYWLCNPAISRAVADLERRGYVKVLKERMNLTPRDSTLFLKSHEQYANERWNSLSEKDKSLLMDVDGNPSIQRMRNMIECSGIAGADYLSQKQDDGSFCASFKCLHAHYAHFRSGCSQDDDPYETDNTVYNPVGLWVHELLQEQFPELPL